MKLWWNQLAEAAKMTKKKCTKAENLVNSKAIAFDHIQKTPRALFIGQRASSTLGWLCPFRQQYLLWQWPPELTRIRVVVGLPQRSPLVAHRLLSPLFCVPANASLHLFLMTAASSQIMEILPACHTCSWRSACGDQPLILAARKTPPGAFRYANKQLTRLLNKVPPGIPLQLAQQEQV